MSTDQDVLGRLKEGDEDTYKQLFEKYYIPLYTFGRSIYSNEDEVREGIQEIFLRLWEKRTDQRIDSLKTYLFTSLKNYLLNYIRHEKIVATYQQVVFLQNKEEDAVTTVSPFLRQAIDNAINELPPRAKSCFLLTQVDGLSMKETAIKLNISDKTVENQLARSRKILQRKLKNFR